jgi:hypothetical protein
MAFSNIVGLIRLHLMTYLSLKDFLRSPEKSLLKQIPKPSPIRPYFQHRGSTKPNTSEKAFLTCKKTFYETTEILPDCNDFKLQTSN